MLYTDGQPGPCCAICGDPNDHDGAPHGDVTGDGKCRAQVLLDAILKVHQPITTEVRSARCFARVAREDAELHIHEPDCYNQVALCGGCGVRYEQCMTLRAMRNALYECSN